MRRRATGSIVANPVLVGAITLLVVVVAVFLAYNANNGLPFVPTRQLDVELPNGADVVPNVEVREGGYRIGVVTDMRAERLRNGRVGAVVRLKIDQKAGEIPEDSRILVRPRSALAQKVVELQRGTSSKTIPTGGRLPVQQSDINTDLDELYDIYDAKTRQGVRNNQLGFGNAFAGRGVDLNTTIRALPELFGYLEPVMRNLSSERTDLRNFFKELGDAARVVAPLSETYARTFRHQADTFEAIARDPEALKATISKSPPTMDASIRSFRVQRPFLRDTALMSRDLNAASRDLRGALPVLNEALEVGTPVTRRSVRLNDDLRNTLVALRDLAAAPSTNGALRGLTATVTTLQPTLRFIGPYITVCNYWNLFWTWNADHFNAPDPTGSTERVLLNSGDRPQNDNVTNNMGANEYATGKGLRNPEGTRQYAHNNVYGGYAIEPDGKASCNAGQQGYAWGANAGDDTPDKFYRRAVMDQANGRPHQPRVGPTFRRFDLTGNGVALSRDQVPPGQTFTATPKGRGGRTPIDAEQDKLP